MSFNRKASSFKRGEQIFIDLFANREYILASIKCVSKTRIKVTIYKKFGSMKFSFWLFSEYFDIKKVVEEKKRKLVDLCET